jgi:aspartyl-tRNA(Asn)/glutamyl-tRNA(Gln) amidotransferase subunit A
MNTEFLTIAEASRRIHAKEMSPLELAQQQLQRIEGLDGQLHSFVTVTGERALDDARAAERAQMAGSLTGPLHGIPIGLKDIIDTAGILTTAGTRWLEHNVPERDAACAAALAKAGTVLLGKLTTHELAVGGPSHDLPWPVARNPWDTERYTHGSSSGTGAATAAGLILGGLGSDTGGSIRGPAALCGIAGIKPTYGLVSRAGVAPAAFSLDHLGPMAWTVEDCAMLLTAIAGHDGNDPASADVPIPDYRAALSETVKGLRIGVIHHFHEHDHVVSEPTQQAIDAAISVFRALGAEITEVRLSPLEQWVACGTAISMTERFAAYEDWARTDMQRFGERARDRLSLAAFLSAADYAQALRRRGELRDEILSAMADVDIVLTATNPGEAPKLADLPKWEIAGKPSFTIPFNVCGFPAMSVCAGFGPNGLPLAIQLAAKPFREATLLRAAHAFECATPHRSVRPTLAASA